MAKSSAAAPVTAGHPAGRSVWPAFILIALLGATVGAMVTYLVLQPRLRPAGATGETSATVAASRVPPPELTAGQPPAQADRNLGNFYYDQGDWTQAVKFYESAIRQGSDDADIRTDLGNAYRFSNRPDDALAQYRTAQRMNPQHDTSLFNQGGLFVEQFKDTGKAIEIWQEYLRRFPQGGNAATARQLLAQAQGGVAAAGVPLSTTGAVAPPPAAGKTAEPDSTEARLMQLVKPKP